MHELALVHELLRRVDALARDRGASRVLAVRVGLGELSGVDPALLRLAFRTSAHFSPARGADLHIEVIPLEGRCESCGSEFPIRDFRFACPDCGDEHVAILRGDELRLEALTLESAEDRDDARPSFTQAIA